MHKYSPDQKICITMDNELYEFEYRTFLILHQMIVCQNRSWLVKNASAINKPIPSEYSYLWCMTRICQNTFPATIASLTWESLRMHATTSKNSGYSRVSDATDQLYYWFSRHNAARQNSLPLSACYQVMEKREAFKIRHIRNRIYSGTLLAIGQTNIRDKYYQF